MIDAKNLLKKLKSLETVKFEVGEQITTSKPVNKWNSNRSLGKTYMGDPKYKWESGRKFGKTYMNNPKYQWNSGVIRGKANNLFY